MAYIESTHRPDEGCIFCDAAATGDDEASFVLARGAFAFVLLNAFPYNPGHIMVAPVRHVSDLEALTPEELADASRLLQRAVAALRQAMAPDGCNLGMNLGRVAGAGIPGHLHWHVVPRWSGDTNFMPVLADVRVTPEHLSRTLTQVRAAWPEGAGTRS